MTSKALAAAWAACAVLLASCGGGGGSGAGTGAGSSAKPSAVEQAKAQDEGNSVRLRVLSSAPEYVSGGDARIEVRAAPGLRDKLELLVMSYLRSNTADPKWQHVVLNRKGTIAMGVGWVNSGKNDFAKHGL